MTTKRKHGFIPIEGQCESLNQQTLDKLVLSMRIKALTHLLALMETLNAKPSPNLKKELLDLSQAIKHLLK